MIDYPPKSKKAVKESILLALSPEFSEFIGSMEAEYPYWSKFKYLVPKGKDKELYWAALKFSRLTKSKILTLGKYTFLYPTNDCFLRLLHEFDMQFGGSLASSDIIPEKNKQYYQISSIMEEAIASSQMEGASTTRKVAKEMLRRQAKPKDRSQQMIANNYRTIHYLIEHQDEKLSEELLLQVHKSITDKTLDNQDYEGEFRKSDDIVVQDGISGEIVHMPPKAEDIPELIGELCDFANNGDENSFIHPIIKAIILHFLVSYIHPFVDGNGRTARSIFYWYMLKNGYWLTEFLSISRVIYQSKTQYEDAFLYTESDDLDLGYFISYNLKSLEKAFIELKDYLARKLIENNSVLELGSISGINERQARILHMAKEKPNTIFICRDFEGVLNATIKTIRSDFQQLVMMGLFREVSLNRKLRGYILDEDGLEKIGKNREI